MNQKKIELTELNTGKQIYYYYLKKQLEYYNQCIKKRNELISYIGENFNIYL